MEREETSPPPSYESIFGNQSSTDIRYTGQAGGPGQTRQQDARFVYPHHEDMSTMYPPLGGRTGHTTATPPYVTMPNNDVIMQAKHESYARMGRTTSVGITGHYHDPSAAVPDVDTPRAPSAPEPELETEDERYIRLATDMRLRYERMSQGYSSDVRPHGYVTRTYSRDVMPHGYVTRTYSRDVMPHGYVMQGYSHDGTPEDHMTRTYTHDVTPVGSVTRGDGCRVTHVRDEGLLVPVKHGGEFPAGWIPGRNDTTHGITFTEHPRYKRRRHGDFYVTLDTAGRTAERRSYTKDWLPGNDALVISDENNDCSIM